MNGPSWSTYLPLLVTLVFLFVAGLGSLIFVLCAARWVLKAYRGGPGVAPRLERMEQQLLEQQTLLEAGILEAKAVGDRRYRSDRQRAKRADKAGTLDHVDPEIQDLLRKGMTPLEDISSTDNGGAIASKDQLRRAVAARKGRR